MIDLATILGLTAPIILLLIGTVIVRVWTARRGAQTAPVEQPEAAIPAPSPETARDAPPAERRRVAA